MRYLQDVCEQYRIRSASETARSENVFAAHRCILTIANPVDTQGWNNIDSTLIQRFESTLFQRCVPAGNDSVSGQRRPWSAEQTLA